MVEILRKILSHLKLIIIISAVLLAVAIAYIVSKGTIYDELCGPSVITYGDPTGYSAKSFLSTMSYEYFDTERNEWSKDPRLAPGTYKLRGVSKRSFGRFEYTEEYEITVLPKSITVSVADTVIYGDQPEISSDTSYGDTVICPRFTYGEDRVLNTSVCADINTLRIVNSEGKDVTNCYVIETPTSNIRIFPRPITITVPTVEKIYDALPLSSDSYNISNGNVATGDILSLTFNKEIINASEILNEPTMTLLDGYGEDVSHLYDITMDIGYLKIKKRPVKITTQSTEYVYSGTEHYYLEYEIDGNTPLLQGHDLVIINSPAVIDAGIHNNIFSFDVKDERGISHGDNYDISVSYGTITVHPAPLKLSTKGFKVEYDGMEHYNDDVSIQGLVNNHTFRVTPSIRVSKAGKYTNETTVTVFDAKRSDVTKNYDITYDYGTIEITKKPLTITTHNIERVYCGYPIKGDAYDTEGLVYGHFFTATFAELTDVGSIVNSMTDMRVFNIYTTPTTSVSPRDSSENLIDNYEITTVYGTITVTPKRITAYASAEQKVYNGAFQVPSAQPRVYGLVDTHSVSDYKLSGGLAVVGTTDIAIVPDSIRISDKNQKDVTKNYEIELFSSTMSIKKREVWIESGSATKRYDGTPLVCNEFNISVDSPYQLAKGHSVKLEKIFGSQTAIGSSPNYFVESTVKFYDENGKDITQYYTLGKITYGDLTVMHTGTITVTTESASKYYNGKTFRNEKYSCDVSDGELLPGHRLILTSFATIIDAGSIPNTATVKIIDEKGRDVKHYYSIKTNWGTLEILPAKLTVYSSSETYMYDGQEHRSIFTRTSGFLRDEDSLMVKSATYVTDVGVYVNEIKVIVYALYGDIAEDVSKNYDITYEYGTLTVTKRPLKISTPDQSWEYDGKAHSANATELITEGLVSGHDISVKCTEITNVGKKTSEVLECTITDNSKVPKIVTENYDISYEFGTISISRRTLSLCPYNTSKVYDGKPISEPYGISAKGLLSTHRIDYELSYETFTDVGTTPVKLINDSVKVSDQNGYDVTSNYRIIINGEGSISVTPRPITIKSDSAEKYYDGTPLSAPSVTSKNLLKGHTISTNVIGTQTEIGSSLNDYDTSSIIICDEYGSDISKNYTVTGFEYGTLTVLSSTEIYVTTGSASKYYDGLPLKNGEYFVEIIGSLVDGDRVEVNVIGSIIDTGTTSNNAVVKIYDSLGNDRTHLYSVIIEQGTLSILERPDGSSYGSVYSKAKTILYLKTASYGNFVNGKWEEAPEYSQTLPGGYSLNYLTSFALKNIGANESQIKIKDNIAYKLPYYVGFSGDYDTPISDTRYISDREMYDLSYYNLPDIAENYKSFQNCLGDLSDEELLYREFVYNNYLHVDDATREYMDWVRYINGFYITDTVSNAHSNIIKEVADYIRSSATYDLDYDRNLDKESNMIVEFLNKYGEGTCHHFASAAVMLFRSIGIPARYSTGFTVTANEGEWTAINSPRHAWVEVYIDGLGWIYVEVTPGFDQGSSSTPTPKHHITIMPEYMYKQYDGMPLFASNKLTMNDSLKKLFDMGYTYSVKVEGAQTEIGTGISKITEFTIYDADNNDVTNQFEIEYQDGYLRVGEKIIRVTLYQLSKFYDGNPLKYEEGDYFIHDLPINVSLELELLIELTNVGSISLSELNSKIDVYARYKVYNEIGEDVSNNYLVVLCPPREMEDYIPIMIEKRVIEITSASVSAEFDDNVLYNERVYVSKGSLAEGDILIAKAIGFLDHVGSTPNKIDESSLAILNGQNENVTENYNVIIKEGTLTLQKLN